MRNVRVCAEQRLDAGRDAVQAIELAIDRALVVQCAETTGAMARALEITLDYLKTRKQFGRVLAGNQVLQHRLVDLHIAIEETRALTRAAALVFAGAADERRRYVAAAKAYASQAARLLWEEVVQLQGAIGMTDEYQLGAYIKHLAVSHTLFGDSEQQFERIAMIEDRLQAGRQVEGGAGYARRRALLECSGEACANILDARTVDAEIAHAEPGCRTHMDVAVQRIEGEFHVVGEAHET